MIHVTETFTPPLAELDRYLQEIWDSKWFTNRGPLVKRLEENIRTKYNSPTMLAVNNGTIAIQLALRALKSPKREVITTPFSYVATTSCIVWEGMKPVFADINEDTLCIDPTLVESKITSDTAAIVATHVFGNMCDVERLEKISDQYGIPIIYDAAHSFGASYKGKSAFQYGDVATTSFHATKLFHTGEGGGIFCGDEELMNTIFYMHNFGHQGKEAFQGLGINAKISELNAALGLVNLQYVDDIIAQRKIRVELYENELNDTSVRLPEFDENIGRNYAYMPVIFEDEKQLLSVVSKLNGADIFPRRYFYPSLNKLPYVNNVSAAISESISSRILCLPLWHSIGIETVHQICDIINATCVQNKSKIF